MKTLIFFAFLSFLGCNAKPIRVPQDPIDWNIIEPVLKNLSNPKAQNLTKELILKEVEIKKGNGYTFFGTLNDFTALKLQEKSMQRMLKK